MQHAPMDDREHESVMLKLIRMEGKIDLLSSKLDDLIPRVATHSTEIVSLCLRVQSLEQGALASRDTAEALAKALKDAKETAEAAARAEAAKTTKAAREEEERAALGWSPVTKVFAVLAATLTVILLYHQLIG